jgi:hypothetical protein
MDINEAVAICRTPMPDNLPDWLDWNDARDVIVDAYLATLREDDGEPITAEWIRGICADYKAGCGVWRCQEEDCVSYLETINGVFVNGRGVCSIKTRGQLRDLLEVLGVGDA